MNNFIKSAIEHSRTTLSIMVFLLFLGWFSYTSIPIELEPNIEVPVVVTTVVHRGISPEDAERLIILPLETEFRAVEKVEEVRAIASEGVATVIVEFDISVESEEALTKINDAIDRARAKIPSTSEEPIVEAISTVDFPAIIVSLSGEGITERTLLKVAIKIQEALESQPNIQEANISGNREEVLEIILDPALLEIYSLSSEEIINNLNQNNQLVAAGSLDKGNGRFAIKVPGLIETSIDAYNIPVKRNGNTVITLNQVATIQRTFVDRNSFARVNGFPSISIEVVRRINSNMIATVAGVRNAVEIIKQGNDFPEKLNVTYTSDQAPDALKQIRELQGNILTAMMLVMVLVVAALGFRSGMLVGLSIPFSFLCSCILLYWIGYTFNFMVMFGMLLALGMLIDGSIVVAEYADRKIAEGISREKAYLIASKRMFWPVVASTATTLAVFLPLLFWPGVSGKFMLYLPVTVFSILVGSLAYALFFCPTIGSLIGKGAHSEKTLQDMFILENGDATKLKNITGAYARLLAFVTKWPISIVFLTLSLLISVFIAYSKFGSGVIFFTNQDPIWLNVSISSRGNLSTDEKHTLVTEVENQLLEIPGIKSLYTASSSQTQAGFNGSGGGPIDQIGYMFIQLHDQEFRELTGAQTIEEIRRVTKHLYGVTIEIKEQEGGPPVGKPIQIQFSSKYDGILDTAVTKVRNYVDENIKGLRDVEDTRSLPGIEWILSVDRAKAAEYGTSISSVGFAVQLLTNGIKLGEYRPDDALEEIDIRIRYPSHERNLKSFESLRLTTPQGQVPLSSFVTFKPQQRTQGIERINGSRVEFLRADVSPGVLADQKTKEIQAWLNTQNFDPRISVAFRGANEEQEKAGAFLSKAFLLALLLMFILLVAQFNSFYHSFLILFAVVMSTAGVLISLLLLGQPFSVILTGVGIVALAGIVVNNNIVLIDTYQYIRIHQPELSIRAAIIRTGAQRFRPVLLTTVTTVLGLLPIAMHLSLNLLSREITYAGAITAYWAPLSSSIVSGLMFATLLTLITTPTMLALPESLRHYYHKVKTIGSNLDTVTKRKNASESVIT